MSQDLYEYGGRLLTTATTAMCVVIAAVLSVRAFRQARAGRGQAAPPAADRPRRLRARVRPWVKAGLATLATALLVLSLAYQAVALTRAAVPRWKDARPPGEVVQSAEWQTWRAQVHEKLSAEPVTEKALAETLRIKLPALPDSATEAEYLRRDQAVADVLLSYEGVRKIFADRFGIRTDFLGTGLSKPLGQASYAKAAVHEYLVANHPDTHDHVWMWQLNPLDQRFSRPLHTLIAGDGERRPPDNASTHANSFDEELKEIVLRVKNKDHPIPPMVRFARFDKEYYRHTLGRLEAKRVFTSNLSEVWDLTIQQAAEKSGYAYKDGDTFFIWVYVPYHSSEFTPATWRQVLARLPDWLESK